MATHDYVIANGTGAAVRSDLNNALAAIVSNNSSSSAPATTYAYQWWADTNANQLKIRNSANNAWITLRELDGTMLIEDGTAAAPGLAFADDLDTGIHSPAADHFGITTGGTQRVLFKNDLTVFNDGGNNVDFRVESDTNTHMLFVDASTNRIGINTASPGFKLHCVESGSAAAICASSDVSADAIASRVALGNSVGTARFTINMKGGGSELAYLGTEGNFPFYFQTNGAEKARLDADGRFLVGKSSASLSNSKLEVTGASNTNFISILNETASDLDGNRYSKVMFRGTQSGGEQSTLCSVQSGHDGTGDDQKGRLTIHTNDGSDGDTPTERVRVDGLGRVGIGTTSPKDYYAQQLVVDTGSAAQSGITIVSDSSNQGMFAFADGNSGDDRFRGFLDYNHSNNSLAFGTNASEQMRIDSVGRLLVGTTSLNHYGTVNAYSNSAEPGFRAVGGSSMGLGSAVATFDKHANTNTTSQVFVIFSINDQNTGSGRINANGASQAAFGSFSDRRLKENIVDLPSQLDNVCRLRPVEFDYIQSEGGGHQTSFIAQEFEEVFPDAVGEREDGMKTLTGWGKTEAILVKALQEAVAKIEILEAKVAALEAG